MRPRPGVLPMDRSPRLVALRGSPNPSCAWLPSSAVTQRVCGKLQPVGSQRADDLAIAACG